jgi:hypothetical protein
MAFVDKLFSKFREGARTKQDTAQAPEERVSQENRRGARGTGEPVSEAEQQKLDLLDARIKSLEDRLREQGF